MVSPIISSLRLHIDDGCAILFTTSYFIGRRRIFWKSGFVIYIVLLVLALSPTNFLLVYDCKVNKTDYQ